MKEILNKMTGRLRLEHKAYSTEKSYLQRAGRFPGNCINYFPQELLGHKDVNTTMIYTHVVNNSFMGVESPFESIGRPGL